MSAAAALLDPAQEQEDQTVLSRPRHDLQDRSAQRAWAEQPIHHRLRVIRQVRELIAERSRELTAAISPALARKSADTLAAEVLPLLAACRFLEREAASILRSRPLGRSGRPLWLAGTTGAVERVPVGRVLVIGPSNYPLFLPAVQALQALVAGNSVVWKPGRGGRSVAVALRTLLLEAGLPEALLTITDESVTAAEDLIRQGVDKIVLTGSAASGRAVLRLAAETLTPVTAELSGSDAMIVLPSADLDTVIAALAFSLRLNGSATCMATRRVLLVSSTSARRDTFLRALRRAVAQLGPVPADDDQVRRTAQLVQEACDAGARPLLDRPLTEPGLLWPTILLNANSSMQLTQADVFAPVLSILEVDGIAGVLSAQQSCPLALTASIFGEEREAKSLARQLEVGTVLINDVIVSTADPRVPFGGRKQSGFGSTRGAEGLLEMTVPRSILVHRGRSRRRFDPTGAAHIGLFAGLAALLYAGTVRQRRRGLTTMVRAAHQIGNR